MERLVHFVPLSTRTVRKSYTDPIYYEAEGMHAVAEARHALRQEIVEGVSVLRGQEDACRALPRRMT